MKSLIIPDPHQKVDWIDAVYRQEAPDRIVMLGDFPDAHGAKNRKDSAVLKLAATMKRWLMAKDCIYVMGNHEAHYAFPVLRPAGNGLWGSAAGWTHRKHTLLNKSLHCLWQTMRLAHWEQGWLISHAGFHAGLMHPIFGLSSGWLEVEERRQFEDAKALITPWTMAGDARCTGTARGRVGGVFWLDWEEEFRPIEGVNQIVGHSFGPEPRWKIGKDSRNLCLDTGCRHYAIIEDGDLTVKSVPGSVSELIG